MDIKIKRKIDFITEELLELQEYLNKYEQTQDKMYFMLIKRYSEEICETCIKLNQLILKKKLHFPKSYQHSFLDLKDYYYFKNSDLEALANTAKFRNELAHEYIDMSAYYAVENSKKILELYPVFLKELQGILEKE